MNSSSCAFVDGHGRAGPAEPAARQTGVLRLRVRVKADDSAPLRGLARKRFFLIPGTLEQNRALIDSDRATITHNARLLLPKARRQCGVDQLAEGRRLRIGLLSRCRKGFCELDQKPCLNLRPPSPRVRKSFGSDETARQWLTTNLTAGFA